MADQSLEDIATQLEAALATETGTTVAPGTVAPVGFLEPSGKKRLSWPEIIQKIREGAGLSEQELLPILPGGFAAPAFYRAGISSGFLPSGATTFTQAPFGSRANRLAIAAGLDPQAAAAPETDAPATTGTGTAVVRQRQTLDDAAAGVARETDADEWDRKYGSGAVGPAAIPGKNMGLGSFLSFLFPGGGVVAGGGIIQSIGDYMTGKTEMFMDLSTANPDLIAAWYKNGEFGDLNTARGREKADRILGLWRSGEKSFTYNGEVADPTTGRYLADYEGRSDLMGGELLDWSPEQWKAYFEGTTEQPENILTKLLHSVGLGGDDPARSRTYNVGYSEDGRNTDKFGRTYAMGGYEEFEDLIENDPELAHKVIQARGRGGFFGIATELYDRAMIAYSEWLQRTKQDDDSGTKTTKQPEATAPENRLRDFYNREKLLRDMDLGTGERPFTKEELGQFAGAGSQPYGGIYGDWTPAAGAQQEWLDRQRPGGSAVISPIDDRFQDAVSTADERRNLGLDMGGGHKIGDVQTYPERGFGVDPDEASLPKGHMGFSPSVPINLNDPGITNLTRVNEENAKRLALGAAASSGSPIPQLTPLATDYRPPTIPGIGAHGAEITDRLRDAAAVSPYGSLFGQEWGTPQPFNQLFAPDESDGMTSAEQAMAKVSTGREEFPTDTQRQLDSLLGITRAAPFQSTWTPGVQHTGMPSEPEPIKTTPGRVIDRAQKAMTYPADSGDPVVAPADTTTGYEDMGLDDFYGEDQGYSGGDTGYEGGFSAWQSGGQIGMQEGGMAPPMPMQQPQEGMASPMPQPQAPAQGAEADIANLGLVADQGAAQPQNGGEQSVQDDVAMQANEGDYILPYETVLLTGLNQLNRYAREAIQLAIENSISLQGTDLDPTDDVPIKVSNYEYHIPKVLVPFFGGGKKYLDKIRDEGLALRTRLEEEKEPSMQEQQPMPQKQQLAAAAPEPQMAQAGPPAPQAPMMQTGGFVIDPNEGLQPTPTTAAVLEGDTSQQTTAYNQLKALQHSKKTQQQPPMVDPTGKVIPQGFAAPQGYQAGTSKGGVQKREYDIHTGKWITPWDELKADKDLLRQPNFPEEVVLALTMLSEDRKGTGAGKQTGHLIMDRLATGKFGNSVKEVALKPFAFSGLEYKYNKDHEANFRSVMATKEDDPLFLDYLQLAKDMIHNPGTIENPIPGALFSLNKKSYAKEQRDRNQPFKGQYSLPKHLRPENLMVELNTVGNMTFYGPSTAHPPPSVRERGRQPTKPKVVTQPDDSSQSPPPPDPYSEEQKQEWAQHGYDIHTETRDAGERDYYV